jgi:hypothetical protein
MFACGYYHYMANRCRRYAGHGYRGSGDAARNRFGAGGVRGVVGTVPEPFRMHYYPPDGSRSVVVFVIMSCHLAH